MNTYIWLDTGENILINQLLLTTKFDSPRSRPDSYRAHLVGLGLQSTPRFIFRDFLELEKQEMLAAIVDVSVVTADGKAGVITSGYLEITGKLLPCGLKGNLLAEYLQRRMSRLGEMAGRLERTSPSQEV